MAQRKKGQLAPGDTGTWQQHSKRLGWELRCCCQSPELPKDAVAGKGAGMAFPAQRCVTCSPFLPFLQRAEPLVPALRAPKGNSSCACPKCVPAPEETCHPCVPRHLL